MSNYPPLRGDNYELYIKCTRAREGEKILKDRSSFNYQYLHPSPLGGWGCVKSRGLVVVFNFLRYRSGFNISFWCED